MVAFLDSYAQKNYPFKGYLNLWRLKFFSFGRFDFFVPVSRGVNRGKDERYGGQRVAKVVEKCIF
jgi:hypothetical protein